MNGCCAALLPEQVPRVDVEEDSDLLERLQSEVALATFHRAEVRPVDSHVVSERFLAIAVLQTKIAQVTTNDSLQVPFHRAMHASGALLKGLHTYK